MRSEADFAPRYMVQLLVRTLPILEMQHASETNPFRSQKKHCSARNANNVVTKVAG
jgi:hypothetical protein